MGPTRKKPWPGLAELGMAFGGLVLGYLVVAVVLGIVGVGGGPWTLLVGPVITAVAAGFYAKVGPLWAKAVMEEGAQGSEPTEPQASAHAVGLVAALSTIAVGLGAALAGSMALGVLFEQLGLQVQEQSTVLEITEGARAQGLDLQAIMLVVSALILAPMAEEWLFRGLLFRRVAAVSGRGLAYGISALGFAAIHGNPAGFVVYLWLGLVFAAVLERTGRLWAAVAVHMGNNGFVLALLFTAGGTGGVGP